METISNASSWLAIVLPKKHVIRGSFKEYGVCIAEKKALKEF